MANNTHWSIDDLKKKGLAQNANGDFVPVKSLVAERVIKVKLPPDFVPISKIGILKTDGTIEPVIKPNAKIKNATKVTNDQGVKFDSLLEKFLYDKLTDANIYFEFQKEYVLQQKFRYRGKAVRAVTLTVDFFLPIHGIIADSKGFQTQQGAIRWKMLKSVLKHLNDEEPEIVILKNKNECQKFVNRLLYQP